VSAASLPALVVFDLAGTTVNDPGGVVQCVADALAAAGLEVELAAVNRLMGLPKPEAIRTLIEASPDAALRGRLAGRVPEIHAEFQRRMVRFYGSDPSVHEIPGATKTFAVLRGAGVRVALDTGFDRPIARVLFERLGWERDGLVDATITSDEVERGRPHPDMILRLMERLGVSETRRVAKVGDTPADLEEGMSAGCGWVVGVCEGSHSRAELAPHPHTHLIGSVAELPALFGL
jgi:phosphonatase-like hydrolase